MIGILLLCGSLFWLLAALKFFGVGIPLIVVLGPLWVPLAALIVWWALDKMDPRW